MREKPRPSGRGGRQLSDLLGFSLRKLRDNRKLLNSINQKGVNYGKRCTQTTGGFGFHAGK